MVYLRVLATPNIYEHPFYFLHSNPNRRFTELLQLPVMERGGLFDSSFWLRFPRRRGNAVAAALIEA
jgi:hypothetical protein